MSMSLTSSESDNETAPKKRRRNEEKFRRNFVGLNTSTGKGISSHLDQQVLLESLKSKDEQDIFLQQLIEKHAIKHRRARSEQPRETAASFKYFLLYRGERKNVCNKAFISMYGITEVRVRRLTDLLIKGKSPHDKSGKNPKKNTISAEVCSKLQEHISSFPTNTTHYGTKDISYLDARLDYPDLDVKYEFYLNYFHDNFSLRFGRPQGKKVLKYVKNSSSLGDAAKRTARAELTVHKRRAKKFYNKLQKVTKLCAEHEDTVALAFDFMHNLPLPAIPVQDIFYLRQLWVNCFGIKNLKTGKSEIFLYHEGVAHKGANDICSMLLKYIDTNIPSSVKNCTFFLMNRNHTMIRFCLALTDTGRFEQIFHYFPVRGHSYLPNDRDFGTMKRMIRKHDPIYTPDEYVELCAQPSNNFHITKLLTSDIK
ncbi:hypothetical protein C0J52_25334 [Blattella germanica]|nr:hypothetical protein C0J52_25334 [Blattella germanica]